RRLGSRPSARWGRQRGPVFVNRVPERGALDSRAASAAAALHADIAGAARAVGKPHRPPSRGRQYRAHGAIRRHVRSESAARPPDRAAARAVAVAGRGRGPRLPDRARPRADARCRVTLTFAPEYAWQVWLAAIVVATTAASLIAAGWMLKRRHLGAR